MRAPYQFKKKPRELHGRFDMVIKNIILPIEFDVPESNTIGVPEATLGLRVW